VVLQTFSLLSTLDSFGEKHKKTLQASVAENCVSYLNKIKKQLNSDGGFMVGIIITIFRVSRAAKEYS